jgi:type II secretory pathway component PulC
MLNNIKLINKILAIIIGLLLLCCIILFLVPVKISTSKGQEIKTTEIKPSNVLTLTVPIKKREDYDILASGRLFGLMKQTPIAPLSGIERPLIIEEEKKPCPPEVIYVLQGVIHGEHGAIAVIKASNHAQNVFAKCGDIVDSYQVTKITKDSLVLKKDGQERIFYLEYPH